MKWQLEQLKFSPLVRLYDVKTKENQQTKNFTENLLNFYEDLWILNIISIYHHLRDVRLKSPSYKINKSKI